jgi:tetratricopeptide (TPR) repeat protein
MGLYGSVDESNKLLSGALADPDYAYFSNAILFGLFLNAWEKKDVAAAKDWTAKLAGLAKPNLDFLSSMAFRLAEKGRTREAELYYRRCIEVDPDYGYANLALARLLKDVGRAKEAIDIYSQLLMRWPDYGKPLAERGWMRVTESIDVASGLDDVRRAASLGEPFAQNLLGKFYWDGGLIPRDAGESVYWWHQSASQYYEMASQNLTMARQRLGSVEYQKLLTAAVTRVRKGAQDGASETRATP